MKIRITRIIGMRFVSLLSTSVFCLLMAMSFDVQAEYFLVYGPPAPFVVCSSCETRHVVTHRYHRPHQYHRVRRQFVSHVRRSSYSVTVFYPVPAYAWAPPPCCCGRQAHGFFYSEPTYPGVYFVRPEDRVVGNRIESDYYGPAIDTGTADNDIY